MPKRIQMTRQRPWRADNPDAVIVARPSKWGNPFAVRREQDIVLFPASRFMPPLRGTVCPRDRAEAVGLFRLGVLGFQERIAFHSPRVPTLDEIRAEIAGRDLACWCPLDQPCHGDVLLELANA